jgi:hypothetical protein
VSSPKAKCCSDGVCWKWIELADCEVLADRAFLRNLPRCNPPKRPQSRQGDGKLGANSESPLRRRGIAFCRPPTVEDSAKNAQEMTSKGQKLKLLASSLGRPFA